MTDAEKVREHKFGKFFLSCLVAHFDKEGKLLPSCRECNVCEEWVPYPYDSECKGKKDTDTPGGSEDE